MKWRFIGDIQDSSAYKKQMSDKITKEILGNVGPSTSKMQQQKVQPSATITSSSNPKLLPKAAGNQANQEPVESNKVGKIFHLHNCTITFH